MTMRYAKALLLIVSDYCAYDHLDSLSVLDKDADLDL